MEQFNFRKCLPLLAFLLPLSLAAKCPPGGFSLVVKQANGMNTSIRPDTAGYELFAWVDRYSTIHLGPGDTPLVHMIQGPCGYSHSLTHNGASYYTTIPFPYLWKCTAAGAYVGTSIDQGMVRSFFSVAPLSSALGPVGVQPIVSLGGALVSTASWHMRVDLKNQGLLATVEPYTALGYVHTAGGGGETLGTGAAIRPLVDWVLVELRPAGQPNVVVASQSAIVYSDGAVTNSNDFKQLKFNVPPGYYHIAIKHRNHLGAMTALPMLLQNGSFATVGFIGMDDALIYGTNARYQVGSNYCLWPGNGKWTGGAESVKYAGANNDRDAVLSRIGGGVPTATTGGYFSEDINLDGTVKYAGADNDRDVIPQTIGGSVPTATRNEQVPY